MPTGSLGYTYYPAGCTTTGCAAGKLASIAGPGAETLAFTYDGQLQKSATWSGLVNGSVAWTYDTDFRKVAETVQAGTTSATAAFGYDADSLLTCASPTTCPSGAGALTITRSPTNALLTSTSLGNVTDAYTYNTYGELATYQAKYGTSSLYSVTYDATGATRDALGRVVQKTETLQGTTHVFGYTYDVQGRLTDVTRDGTAIEHYGYDLNGNRTTATVNATTVNPTYDDQDRLLTYGATTFSYSANGEVTTRTDSSGSTSYVNDARGHLSQVTLPSSHVIDYVLDGNGRRIAKIVDGVVTKQWLWTSKLRIGGELDAAGNVVSQFVYGTKRNVPEFLVRNGKTYRVITDHLGSPVLVINTADATDVLLQAQYDGLGNRTVVIGTEDVIPFGFAGGQYDADTKLIRFGARDYDSRIGRWLHKEPLRFKAGTNFYVYAWDDPINFLDPSGRDPNGAGGASSTGGGGCEGTSSNGNPLTGPGPGSFAPDSCGGSDWTYLTPDGAFGADWSAACDLHDDCYSMCSADKSTCDQDLNTNISNSCSWCSAVGNAYQWGVSGKTGQDKYNAAQGRCHP